MFCGIIAGAGGAVPIGICGEGAGGIACGGIPGCGGAPKPKRCGATCEIGCGAITAPGMRAGGIIAGCGAAGPGGIA